MPDHYLYEYRTRLHLAQEVGLTPAACQALEEHLQRMWDERPVAERTADAPIRSGQRYVQFHRDGTISARNFVGVIRCGEATLHLLPKVFFQPGTTAPPPARLQTIQGHLYWWLSYSQRLRFPRNQASFEALPTDLLEVLVLLFAQHTRDLLTRSYYQQYQQVHEQSSTLRGRLDLGAYTRNFASGRGHWLPCTYDSFQADNRFNRILKYVVRRLLSVARHATSRRLLEEIHFFLDEVTDQPATAADCEGIQLSPLFAEYQITLAYCQLFLLGASPAVTSPSEREVFALLLPSELVFEEFLAGFVQEHLADAFRVRSQAQDLYLARVLRPGTAPQRRFQLRHDLLLEPLPGQGQALILDAKYKVLPLDAGGRLDDKAVAQPDLYQLVSYAFRRGTRAAHLLYPDTLLHPATDAAANRLDYAIDDPLTGQAIHIAAHRLPMVCPAEAPASPADYARQEHALAQRLRTILLSPANA